MVGETDESDFQYGAIKPTVVDPAVTFIKVSTAIRQLRTLKKTKFVKNRNKKQESYRDSNPHVGG